MNKKVIPYAIALLLLIVVLVIRVTSDGTNNDTEDAGKDSVTQTTQNDKPTQNNDSTQDKEPVQGEQETESEDTSIIDSYLADDSIVVVGKETLPYTPEEIYTQLFNLENRVDIEIDISNEEMLNIQKDYEKYSHMGSKSPIYRPASIYIKIDNKKDKYTYYIPNVGFRMKGNTSRTNFYDEQQGQYNLVHYRVKFLEGDFATLEGLELKWNRNDDSTYVREIYAYDMYRDLGVLAPRVSLATMEVADVQQGVFFVYEPVDKNFIERYVDKKDQGGDLYKCAWTHNGASLTLDCSVGIEDEDKVQFFNYDLKTNKKTSKHERMKNLLEVLNRDGVTRLEIESVVDIPNFMMFAAISYFVGNPDDIRNNYNNHYIYFLKSTGRAVFIPYDMDRVFGVTAGYNPMNDGMTSVSPFSNRAEGAGEEQRNPLFRYTVAEEGYYKSEYVEALEQVAYSKWFKFTNFEKWYASARNNYADSTKPSKKFYNAEYLQFSFDINRSAGLDRWDANASFADYVYAKMDAYQRHVSEYVN